MKRRFGEVAAVDNLDYQAKLEARRRDPNQTQVLICRGDHPPGGHPPSEFVWFPGNTDGPKVCAWQTRGCRCRMVGMEDGYCGFHRACINNGTDHPTMQEFAGWLSNTDRWRGDLDFLWARLTGYIWLIPIGPSEHGEPVGAPKTKAEAMDLASAVARGVLKGRRGIVVDLREMAKKYPANAAWYCRESDRMERESENEGEVPRGEM